MADFDDLVAMKLGAAVPTLIKISGEGLDDPIFIVDNNEEVVYNGDTYVPVFMSVELPSGQDEDDASATLTITNVDQSMIGALRTIMTPLKIEVMAVLYKIRNDDGTEIDPPTISDLEYWAGELQEITVDAQTIKGTVANQSVLARKVPQYVGNNFINPALA